MLSDNIIRNIMNLMDLSRQVHFLGLCEPCGRQDWWPSGTEFMVNHFKVNSKRVEGEVSRRDKNEKMGRFIESYLILPNPKMDDRGWMVKRS